MDGQELEGLRRVRWSMLSYGLLLSILAGSGGVAMSSWKSNNINGRQNILKGLFPFGAFGLIGGFFGVALGLQRGLLNLEQSFPESNLVKEMTRLRELRMRYLYSKARGRQDSDPIEVDMERDIFNARNAAKRL